MDFKRTCVFLEIHFLKEHSFVLSLLGLCSLSAKRTKNQDPNCIENCICRLGADYHNCTRKLYRASAQRAATSEQQRAAQLKRSSAQTHRRSRTHTCPPGKRTCSRFSPTHAHAQSQAAHGARSLARSSVSVVHTLDRSDSPLSLSPSASCLIDCVVRDATTTYYSSTSRQRAPHAHPHTHAGTPHTQHTPNSVQLAV